MIQSSNVLYQGLCFQYVVLVSPQYHEMFLRYDIDQNTYEFNDKPKPLGIKWYPSMHIDGDFLYIFGGLDSKKAYKKQLSNNGIWIEMRDLPSDHIRFSIPYNLD